MLIAAPNIQICPSHILTGIEAILAPNGGSRRSSVATESVRLSQRPATSPVRCSRSARRWTAAQVR